MPDLTGKGEKSGVREQHIPWRCPHKRHSLQGRGQQGANGQKTVAAEHVCTACSQRTQFKSCRRLRVLMAGLFPTGVSASS